MVQNNAWHQKTPCTGARKQEGRLQGAGEQRALLTGSRRGGQSAATSKMRAEVLAPRARWTWAEVKREKAAREEQTR